MQKTISKQEKIDIRNAIAKANFKMVIRKLRKIGGVGHVTSALKSREAKTRFLVANKLQYQSGEYTLQMEKLSPLIIEVLEFTRLH